MSDKKPTKFYYMRVAARRWPLRLAALELGLTPRELSDIEWGREVEELEAVIDELTLDIKRMKRWADDRGLVTA